MFLRCKKRRKDGKEHHYWSIVENRRITGGRVLPRHVLYLGDMRRFGYSRDKRSDCVQVVIALIVTPEGFPIAY